MTFRSIVIALGLSVLGACQVDDGRPDDGGQSGTAIPDGCYEDHRVVVLDLQSVPEDFLVSAADAMAELTGDWVGSGDLADGGGTIEASFTVAHDGGVVEAVYTAWHESGGEGGGEGEGAPTGSSTVCDPYYAFGVVTSLDAAPWVSGEGAGPVYVAHGSSFFTAETPLEDVSGDLAPSFDTSAWDRASLASTLTVGDTVTLDLAWWGSNDVEQRAATSTGTATTGTIEPSGTTEPIATIPMSRPPQP